ncbi:MAG TPA: beta-N-acetylhexosaminidase [Steroidobacter sp.]|uniref:beta-N-acetylhexosaminidase n=1 Tax=Steroidobacter sp. TaxID=1978227 RepID=UPI002ED9F30E
MTLGPLMIDVQGTTLTEEDRELLAHPLVGAVILFTRNFESVEQLQRLVADIRAVRSPPLLVTVDHEGGRVQRFRKGFTVLPSMRVIGRQYDLDPVAGRLLARQCGWLMAAELRAVGIDMSFAPCVDLDYGASTVIGDRSFHRDARIVSELAIAFMGGMREAGMAATAKHYPGHGFVAPDSHVAMPVDRRPLADMDEDLTPYRRLIDNGLASIMAAHVIFTDVDDKPAGFSRRWLQSELRGRLGFEGAIFTDDLSMAGAKVVGDMPARAKAALEAGCDVLSLCNDRQGVLQVIDSLRGSGDPLSQVRMARLHGKPGLPRDALHASLEWRACEGAVKGCMERPDLRLNA